MSNEKSSLKSFDEASTAREEYEIAVYGFSVQDFIKESKYMNEINGISS